MSNWATAEVITPSLLCGEGSEEWDGFFSLFSLLMLYPDVATEAPVIVPAQLPAVSQPG